MLQIVNRPQVTLKPSIRTVTFTSPLSFQEIKNELKLLKKSYKDILEWNVVIENNYPILTFSGSTSNSYAMNYNDTLHSGINFTNGASITPLIDDTVKINTNNTITKNQ